MEYKKCPLTYQFYESELKYSDKGLRRLAPKLKKLDDFPYTAAAQRLEAANRTKRMSIQGAQPKLSVQLNISQGRFEIVDIHGKFILKPQHKFYLEMPENEDLTMRLANMIGIETPIHGLIYCIDGSLTYFIKRFDRTGRNNKLAVEDFAQLAGETRNTKYNYTMEGIVKIINEFCTFPMLEKMKLFKITLFSFLIGNEDMHLKNFSIITRKQKIELSPAYDLVNSTICLGGTDTEMALSINGQTEKLEEGVFLDYFAKDCLDLADKSIIQVLTTIQSKLENWEDLIKNSFLSDEMKEEYLTLLNHRVKRLKL